MSAAIEDELRGFAAGFLEQAGALVEWPAGAETGSVLAPASVAQALAAPAEAFTISARPSAGTLTVSLAGEFLDLAGQVLDRSAPRIGSFQLGERYLKKADIAPLVERAFAWPNARVRLVDVGPARVEYQTWHYHALLRSEDSFETCVAVTLNSASRAAVELPDLLAESDLAMASANPDGLDEPGAVSGHLAALRAIEAAAGFLARMDVRLARDERRLRDYYQALLREASAPNRRTKTVASPEAMAAKKEAVQLELRRKLGELKERYQISAVLTPRAVVRCRIPVLALDFDVTRKRSRRKLVVYWNSVLKALEPLACQRCAKTTFCVYFSEEDVAPFCRGCWDRTSV